MLRTQDFFVQVTPDDLFRACRSVAAAESFARRYRFPLGLTSM